jgi:hypothetical protein
MPAKAPMEFTWSEGRPKEVILTGTFDNWKGTVPMKSDAKGLYKANVILPTEGDVQFKFIVDGAWQCSSNYTTCTDGQGNLNNVKDFYFIITLMLDYSVEVSLPFFFFFFIRF